MTSAAIENVFSDPPKTWAEFVWPAWVPERIRTSVMDFWSDSCGRGPRSWLDDARRQGGPAIGDRVSLPKLCGGPKVSGRFVHAWNGIGRIVTDDGSVECVSISMGGSGVHGCCVDKRYGSPRGCNESTCMELPTGKTCGDCAHIKRCLAFGFTGSADRTSCDFFPRRFRDGGVAP